MTPDPASGAAPPGNISVGQIGAGRDITNVAGNLTQIVNEQPTPIIRSLHQLRAPVSDFVGRQDEIDQLVHALSKASESGAAAISGARGMGGIGKTELAYAVAQRLADTFPDAQLLIEMRGVIGIRGASDNPMTPEQALQTVIRAFEPLAQLPDDLNGLRSAYLTLLNGKRVLVLADDARDANQVQALLPPPGCALLLTSRQRFKLPGMETVDLETLSPSEAKKLLLEIHPPIGAASTRMAQLCGRLPLALRVYAGVCANSTRGIEYHLRALEDARARLTVLRDPDDPTTSVEASLQLSYAALDTPAQQVLCRLGVFPASLDMYAAKAVAEGPGVGEQKTTTTHPTIEDVLDLLYRRSLLEWDEQTGRYSLHDLVRAFALARLEGEDAVRMRHAVHYAGVAALADELYQKGGENLLLGLKLFDGERAHIDAGWSWAQAQVGGGSQEIDQLLLDYAHVTVYLGDLRYDKRRERISQFEVAIGAAQRLGNKDAEGRVLSNLGVAYEDLGETRKAIGYHEQHLQITREIGYRRGESGALGNLGVAYAALGETRKAIGYHEQHLQIAREIGYRRGEGRALGNLGLAYAALGETRKAIGYHEQHLQITREIGDRRSEGIALGNLGITYAELGETRKAIEYYEQQLQITREIGDRRGEAITSWNLGILLKESDRARGVELMQIRVDYEREIGHVDAEKGAALVEELREKLA
ncbi:MAG: tetratricopeptide repeat protein [Chloroflexia bacterium]